MTDASAPEPAQPTDTRPTDTRKWYEKKRVLLPVVALAAFLLGLGAGASGTPEATQDTPATEAPGTETPATESGEAAELAARVEELEAERDTLQTQMEEQAAQIEDLQTQLAASRDAAEEAEQAEDERAAQGADGSYAVGSYEFTDVQVAEDFAGQFEMRARVTNNGNDVSGVAWTATLLAGGSVVGTLQATATDFAAGDTITAEFISDDEYTEWDEVEFQVDTEF